MIDPKLIDSFDPISLKEMEKVRLMNRVDSKYITDIDHLRRLLPLLSPHYYIQQIDTRRNMPYYTRYFDTPDTDMYRQHQRGKRTRQKIRIRHYEDCDILPFIEVKSKDNHGRTRKRRLPMKYGFDLAPYHEFISENSSYDPKLLTPRLENHFYRITLVSRDLNERITIDTDLEFLNLTNNTHLALSGFVIIECKRDGRLTRSPIAEALRDLRIHPSGFSKYCIGLAATNPSLPRNRLKQKLRTLRL